jgi:hypothetical protein
MIGVVAVVVAGCTSGPFGDPVPDPKIEDPNQGPGRKPFAAIQPGECISGADFAGTENKPATTSACPNASAPYELVSRGPLDKPCPDGKGNGQDSDYATVVHTSGTSLSKPQEVKTLFCFAYNVVPGDCYTFSKTGAEELRGTSCPTSPNPDLLKAVAQYEGDPEAGCDPGQERFAWSKPARVVCLAPT